MDAVEWLGLQPTHNPHRWFLLVTPGISTGHRFLFGGSGLGAAVAALEGTADRPVVWATAQYLSFAPTDSIMDIDVDLAVVGGKTTQARATGHVGGTEILTVNAALGTREFPVDDTWVEPPAVQAPEACSPRSRSLDVEAIHTRLDQRLALRADGEPDRGGPMGFGPGRSAMWVRLPDLIAPGAATLCVLGDWVPMGVHMASGQENMMANSLDNTVRVVNSTAATEWYLLDIGVQAVHAGFGHGYQHIWNETGDLLAVASQSVLLRKRPTDLAPPPSRGNPSAGTEANP